MRWRFADSKNKAETKARRLVVKAIDVWWDEFRRKSNDLSALFKQQKKWDLASWVRTYLDPIHPKLFWEFGPAVRVAGHRLVITPEANHALRPLVQTVLDRAPTIPGWEFYGHRLAEGHEEAKSMAVARAGVDVSDYRVIVSRGKHNRVDLEFVSPGIDSEEDEKALHAAFVVVETALGEQLLNNWIGGIDVRRATGRRKKGEPTALGLDRLAETVNAIIAAIHDQLPADPHWGWVEKAEWTMWKLNPEPADDFRAQADLFVGKSANPVLWVAAHNRGLFASERFGKCGETFCYVKIDGSQGLEAEAPSGRGGPLRNRVNASSSQPHEGGTFADKGDIEDAIDAVLVPAKLGCHIGGGTGLRYSYIDLALTDVARGIEAVRNRLREGNIPKRTWIQFFDSDLAAEWVGMYDDTPPPPFVDAE